MTNKFDAEDIELPKPPSKKERDFTKKAASTRVIMEGITDNESEDVILKKLPRARKKKEVKLAQVSLKLHPDIIKAVAEIAKQKRKMPAEVMRDLILKGINAEGIEL